MPCDTPPLLAGLPHPIPRYLSDHQVAVWAIAATLVRTMGKHGMRQSAVCTLLSAPCWFQGHPTPPQVPKWPPSRSGDQCEDSG